MPTLRTRSRILEARRKVSVPTAHIKRLGYSAFMVLALFTLATDDTEIRKSKVAEVNDHVKLIRLLKNARPQRKISQGGKLVCDVRQMQPSRRTPRDVDHVRPADFKYIGAMGDSFMAGFHSTNYDTESLDVFPGNSFFTGADETLDKHVTIANILREFNPEIEGASFGKGFSDTNLNVAELEATSEDLPRQAQELVDRIRLKGENARNKWKMIAIFAGLHDLGYLTCYNNSKKAPTTEWNFRIHFEEALTILRYRMKNTIVVLVPVIKPQVLVGARYKLDGITVPCWKGKSSTLVREDRVHWFNKMLEKVQYERKFESKSFAVVVRPFTNNIADVIRVEVGMVKDAFYAEDHFHFSKYGNALFATYLWNSLFDPVGKKSTIRNLTDAAVLECPPKVKYSEAHLRYIEPRTLLTFTLSAIMKHNLHLEEIIEVIRGEASDFMT